MKAPLPDIEVFCKKLAGKRNVLAALICHARRMTGARMAGLVYGTDDSGEHFLPPDQWDRGIMDRFDGQGILGVCLKFAGRQWARQTGISPVFLFTKDLLGERQASQGITAYALRHHQDYYSKGIKILLVETTRCRDAGGGLPGLRHFSMASYDGRQFAALNDVRADINIVDLFRAKNFIAAYIPDYGAIVFNTVQDPDLAGPDGRFIFGNPLKARLDHLISAIQAASLHYLSQARGPDAVRLITRKEMQLRRTAAELARKKALLQEQEDHLFAVGAVTAEQLSMEAVSVHDGVFAFVDMAGSVKISQKLSPRAYLFILNLCNAIAAKNARQFGCRVDNIIGDSIFFESLFLFDREGGAAPGSQARLMRMTCMLASFLGDIRDLAQGKNILDREMRAASLFKAHNLSLGFRTGMSLGRAVVGPVGSPKRRIVTAIGDAVAQASRLERTGKVNHIHTIPLVAGLLTDAWVSRDTPKVFEFSRQVLAENPGWSSCTGFSFVEFYRVWRGLDQDFLKEKTDACHKEFAGMTTCLIPCFPERMIPDTCPGI